MAKKAKVPKLQKPTPCTGYELVPAKKGEYACTYCDGMPWYEVRYLSRRTKNRSKPAPSPLAALKDAVVRAAVEWDKACCSGRFDRTINTGRILAEAVCAYRKAGGKS